MVATAITFIAAVVVTIATAIATVAKAVAILATFATSTAIVKMAIAMDTAAITTVATVVSIICFAFAICAVITARNSEPPKVVSPLYVEKRPQTAANRPPDRRGGRAAARPLFPVAGVG